MRSLVLLLTIFLIVWSSCPDGFELVRDGECRGKYTTMDIAWDKAPSTVIQKCNEIHAKPVIIHDEEHQSYWTNLSEGYNPNPYLVLSLQCNSTSKLWEWSDGSAVDYKPSNVDSHFGKDCIDNCTWILDKAGKWGFDCVTATYKFNIFCTTHLQSPPASGDGCDGFEDDSEDGVCYQVGATAQTWPDAQMNCKKLGADLASVHSLQENSFIRRLAVSKGATNGVFLGATLSGKGQDYGWVDGSAWDYENFHQGFPLAGFGDCIAMDTSVSTGEWMNMDCSADLPVACIRDQRAVAVPTCSAGPWAEGTIITSPGFPFSASTYCDFFLTVEAGKRVEVEIIFLEANTCCDSLVIYDGYLGAKVMATLTGEVHNATYTTTSANIMRVNWQPNGGVNVRGMGMTYRGV